MGMRLRIAVILIWTLACHSGAFDPKDGLMMAYLEQAAYCSAGRFDRWDVGDSILHGPRVDQSRLRQVEDTKVNAKAGVGKMLSPRGCFIAIKGTTGKIDSLLDAFFWQVAFDRASCPGCQVEHGFLVYYEGLKQGIFKALHDFGCAAEPLYLVGHSLGAASLHYLLFDALDLGYKVKRMYALESPRPGNPTFSAILSAKVNTSGVDARRVAHHKDVVVHLPPRALDFEHALPEIYFPGSTGSTYRECGVEDSSCSNSWMLWELTGKDHCWYSDLNPCGCHNDTHTPPRKSRPLFPEFFV